MSKTLIQITSGNITWEKSETDITQDEIAFVDIKVVGYTDASMDIASALAIVPATLPISSTGPVGNSTLLTGAQLQRRGARYDGDGTIRLDATYKAYTGTITNGPGGGTDEQSAPEDKVNKRIQTVEEPLLTHPIVVTKFPTEQVNMLSALISGYIRPAFDVSQETGGTPIAEFVRQDPTTDKWDYPAIFDNTGYSVEMNDGTVEASPLEYARLIKAGITSWKNTGTVLTWSAARNEPTSESETNKVGSVVSPPIAPNIDGRDWFYEGINETQSTNSLYIIERDYTLSGPGGAFKQIYARGTADIGLITPD